MTLKRAVAFIMSTFAMPLKHFPEVDEVSKIIENYNSFKDYLFQFCKRDEYSVLCVNCESGECGHWPKQFGNMVSKICDIAAANKVTKKFSFTRFLYTTTNYYATLNGRYLRIYSIKDTWLCEAFESILQGLCYVETFQAIYNDGQKCIDKH